MGLAERRHQFERAKARAWRLLKRWGFSKRDERQIGRYAGTRKPCSCECCQQETRRPTQADWDAVAEDFRSVIEW